MKGSLKDIQILKPTDIQMKTNIPILGILTVFFLTAGCVKNVTIPNDNNTTEAATILNKALISSFDNSVYQPTGVKAYAVNNGLVVYSEKDKFTKEDDDKTQAEMSILLQDFFVNVIEDCSVLNRTEYILIRMNNNFLLFQDDEINKLCDPESSLKDIPNSLGALPDHIYRASTQVFVERRYARSWGDDPRDDDYILEP